MVRQQRWWRAAAVGRSGKCAARHRAHLGTRTSSTGFLSIVGRAAGRKQVGCLAAHYWCAIGSLKASLMLGCRPLCYFDCPNKCMLRCAAGAQLEDAHRRVRGAKRRPARMADLSQVPIPPCTPACAHRGSRQTWRRLLRPSRLPLRPPSSPLDPYEIPCVTACSATSPSPVSPRVSCLCRTAAGPPPCGGATPFASVFYFETLPQKLCNAISLFQATWGRHSRRSSAAGCTWEGGPWQRSSSCFPRLLPRLPLQAAP